MAQADPEKSLDYRVMEIFADILGLDSRADIDPESLIRGELGVDSLDLAEIVTEIETRFEVEVDADQADKWVAVKDVIRYVRGKLPLSFSQADVDAIVARAKELGAGPGADAQAGSPPAIELRRTAWCRSAGNAADQRLGWQIRPDLRHSGVD